MRALLPINKLMKRLLIPVLMSTIAYAGEVEQRDMYCDTTKQIVETLKTQYNEIPVITGKVDDVAGSILTIWTNPATDSWSIVATKDDTSCIIGVGQNLKVVPYRKHKSV